MTYSRDDSIKKIVDFKKQWEDANNAGDLVAKGNAEKYAKKVYEMMRANGDSDVADELSASDYTKAQQVQAKYNQITNNNPVADTVQQPVSSSVVSKENADVTEKYKKIFQTATEENPYETEVGKSIMGKFNLAAIQGRENQLASGAATNGGNIDSFSAANAMRQQAALVYQGQEAALAAQQQKIDNAQKILEGMGVHIDRMYNQDETTKNNEVSRLVAKSEVTGYVPKEWQYSNNPYFNSDGTLNEAYTSEDFDNTGGFTTIINNAKAKLATTTDATERANLEATIKYATQAKAYKTLHNPKYAQYAHEVEAVTPDRTSTHELTEQQIASAERIAQNESQSELDQINAQIQGEKEILGTQAALGLTGGNEEIPNQINADDPRFVDIVSQKDDGTYTVNNGVDYYGSRFIDKMKEWLSTNYGGVINLDNENERAAFINAIPRLSEGTGVTLGQLRNVMDFIGVGGVIKVDELFVNHPTRTYRRNRDGATWPDGVVKKQKDDSKTV